MKPRELVQIAAIIILATVLGIHLATDIGHPETSSLSSGKQVTKAEHTLIQSAQAKVLSNSTTDDRNDLDSQVPNLTAIFKQVENSVVSITSKVATVNSHIIINGSPLEGQSTRLGSGFVYDKSGHIITNNHVVEGASTVDVTFVDGNTYTAKVIGTDVYSDMAVLQITDAVSEENLIPVIIGDSSKLEVGQQVIAIGNPFGLSDTMTTGIVSQTGRLLPNQELGFSIPDIIQTDAAINPGNSGGPLLNVDGEVIGINTAIKSSTGEFSGIGFAIPSSAIKRIIPTLIEKGSYSHPWLGISGTSLTPDLAKSLGLPRNAKGVFVNAVAKDGPAQKAGLVDANYNENHKVIGGDVITAVDGHPVRDIEDIIFYIEEHKSVGENMMLTITRNGHELNLSATLHERSR